MPSTAPSGTILAVLRLDYLTHARPRLSFPGLFSIPPFLYRSNRQKQQNPETYLGRWPFLIVDNTIANSQGTLFSHSSIKFELLFVLVPVPVPPFVLGF